MRQRVDGADHLRRSDGSDWTTLATGPSNPVRPGRCVALYPGAFRPPHKVHFAAIVDLACRPDVDEVVVIIANRSRQIPGTTLALDAVVAHRVLAIYLQDMPKVRLEIAPHNAVKHALTYLQRARQGDALLFCAGEADLANGDDRFEDLISMHRPAGVSASVVPLPTGAFTTRATALRRALAEGEAGREVFMAALPDTLNDTLRERVWSICRHGLREMNDIVVEKLRALLDPGLVGDEPELACVVAGKMDPVFRVRCPDGRHLFVKYAGETAESGTLGHPFKPKPRRRLSTERRAIECLRTHLPEQVAAPEVLAYDKACALLVLSEVGAKGRTLESHLKVGCFDTQVAARIGALLAGCHALDERVPALWGRRQTDLRHWADMLALRTVDLDLDRLGLVGARRTQVQADLQRLRSISDDATGPGLHLLDCCPKNIVIEDGRIGLIDLELCASRGDPAYDLGTLLGAYVHSGLSTCPAPMAASTGQCEAAVGAILAAYRKQAPDASTATVWRAVAFAGATVLRAVQSCRGIDAPCGRSLPLTVGAALLAKGLEPAADAGQWLSDAVNGRLAASN